MPFLTCQLGRGLTLLSLAITPPILHANELINKGEWQFAVAFGSGAMQNPRSKGHALRSPVLPSWRYYGDRVFIENTTVGYQLWQNSQWLIDVQGQLNHDGLWFEYDGINKLFLSDVLNYTPNRDPLRPTTSKALPAIERRLSYLAGWNVTWLNDVAPVRIGRFTDISGVHHGSEWWLSTSKKWPLADGWFGPGAVAVEFAFNYKEADLVAYYYEITAEEANARKGTDITRSSLNSQVKLVYNRKLTEHWSAIATAQYSRLGNGMTKSLLVDQDHYWSWFIGVSYKWRW